MGMKERMDAGWRWLAVNMGKHAGVVSAVGLVITIIMGFGLTKLDFATDQDAYLNEGEQVLIDSVEYQDLFGGQAMLAAIRLDEDTTLEEFVSPENQKIFEEIEETLIAQDGISAVATPYNTLVLSDRLIQNDEDGKKAADITMQAGAEGVKIQISGRLGGSEMARREKTSRGSIPLHTLKADISYGFATSRTNQGAIGVKCWIYRGDLIKNWEADHGSDAQTR